MVTSMFRWMALGCGIAGVGAGLACGGPDPEPAGEPALATAAGQIYRGCIGQTGEPGVFLFTVSEGRDATMGAPAGTSVPHSPTQLPPGSPRPEPRVATEQLPGKGPDPIYKTESYRLVGSGGLDLTEHVGHTVEIEGELQQAPAAQPPAAEQGQIFPELRVSAARHLADECKP